MPRVLVVCGGRSLERPISLESGARIARALRARGEQVTVVEPGQPLTQAVADIRPAYAFIALHGAEGEDGTVQSVLDLLGVPYTGSDACASALCLDKAQFKTICRRTGIPTPDWITFTRDGFTRHQPPQLIDAIAARFPGGVVIKPADQGSSLGISLARGAEQVRQAVLEAFNYSERVVAEAFVPGREIAVTVVGSNAEPRALPPLELLFDDELYSYAAHYNVGSSRLVRFDAAQDLLARVEEIAVQAYRTAGCCDVARVDLRLDGNDPQVLEINTIPGFTETGPSPIAADEDGMTFDAFVELVAQRARSGR
jgi:D-alanine-D-alanine ligase